VLLMGRLMKIGRDECDAAAVGINECTLCTWRKDITVPLLTDAFYCRKPLRSKYTYKSGNINCGPQNVSFCIIISASSGFSCKMSQFLTSCRQVILQKRNKPSSEQAGDVIMRGRG